MLCSSCRTRCAVDDIFCRRCGADLSVPSKSLVPVGAHLPTVLHNPQLPRVAAGVGALAVGVGLELLRRSLLARLARSASKSAKLLPTPFPESIQDLFSHPQNKSAKVPKGHEIHEVVVYMSRVIRREH